MLNKQGVRTMEVLEIYELPDGGAKVQLECTREELILLAKIGFVHALREACLVEKEYSGPVKEENNGIDTQD
jgi:hypothetical protein